MRLIPISLLVLTGCVMAPKPITQSQLANIEKGRTTQAEAQAMFGTPTSVQTVDAAYGWRLTVLQYASKYLTKANQRAATIAALNRNPPSGGAKLDDQIVNLYIGTNGVVERIDVIQGGLSPPERQLSKSDQANKRGD